MSMELISLYAYNFVVSEYKDPIWKNIRDARGLSGKAKKSGSGM